MTSIEWTDRTWNPIRGCSRVSEGCRFCYAEAIAARFSNPGNTFHGFAERTPDGPRWTGDVVLLQDRLTEPLTWKKPARVFVNSMSDLFHENLSDAAIVQVFGIMARTPQHTYQVLTKRADRMMELIRYFRPINGPSAFSERVCRASGAEELPWPLPNVWLGVSVENQHFYDERIGKLLRTPAAVRFISYEPALGPLDLRLGGMSMPDYSAHDPLPKLDWLICGGESGHGARPFDLAWARSIVEQCRAVSVPVFVKQMGSKAHLSEDGQILPLPFTKKGGIPEEWPSDLRVREFPTVRA